MKPSKNNPNLPIEPRESVDYFARLRHNPEFTAAYQEISGPHEVGRVALQRVVALTASRINEKSEQYTQFDRDYNHLISLLPDLDLGLRHLNEGIGNRKDNLRRIIPFNHAVKDMINRQRLKEKRELTALTRSLVMGSHFDKDLYENINRHIIPGMIHELALEANLYYIPGDPEIVDTTVEDELQGIDYLLRFEDGVEIELDVKRSEEAAQRARDKRNEWRQSHNITSIDNHIITHTGYNDNPQSVDYDFVEGSIARVKESARIREQQRIDTLVATKHAEVLTSLVGA